MFQVKHIYVACETYLDKHPQHGQTIGMTSRLGKGLVLGLIPVHQMQLSSVRLAIYGVLRALVIVAAPMRVELLQHIFISTEGSPRQLRVLSVDVHAPTVAGIHQAASILRNVFDLQGLGQLTALGRALRADVNWGLALAAGQWEQLSPLLGSWEKKKRREGINFKNILMFQTFIKRVAQCNSPLIKPSADLIECLAVAE